MDWQKNRAQATDDFEKARSGGRNCSTPASKICDRLPRPTLLPEASRGWARRRTHLVRPAASPRGSYQPPGRPVADWGTPCLYPAIGMTVG